jgi:hypothetical protein
MTASFVCRSRGRVGFRKADGTLSDHPITRGRDASGSIHRINAATHSRYTKFEELTILQTSESVLEHQQFVEPCVALTRKDGEIRVGCSAKSTSLNQNTSDWSHLAIRRCRTEPNLPPVRSNSQRGPNVAQFGSYGLSSGHNAAGQGIRRTGRKGGTASTAVLTAPQHSLELARVSYLAY